jgi:hypothetical protein
MPDNPAPLDVSRQVAMARVQSSVNDYQLAWRARMKNYLQAHFAILSEPRTVLPYPPDAREKLLYLDTNRSVLLVMGVFSFLSASAGIWLFTVSSSIFAWFSIFATFVQIHLTIFYFTGVFGKDFDYKKHVEIKENFAVLSPESAPSVDIYLPCCKEPLEILRNTYKYIANLEYPASRLKVYVLDDGASDEVKRLAKSFNFTYILRDNRPELKKAGNLRWAFARTDGDLFVIYDAVSGSLVESVAWRGSRTDDSRSTKGLLPSIGFSPRTDPENEGRSENRHLANAPIL